MRAPSRAERARASSGRRGAESARKREDAQGERWRSHPRLQEGAPRQRSNREGAQGRARGRRTEPLLGLVGRALDDLEDARLERLDRGNVVGEAVGGCGSGCQSRCATGERGREERAGDSHTEVARLGGEVDLDDILRLEDGLRAGSRGESVEVGCGAHEADGGRARAEMRWREGGREGESHSTASRLGGSPGGSVVRERVQEVDRQGQAYLVGEDEREAETGVVGRDLCEATAAEDARGREGGTAGEGEDHGRGGAGRRSSCAWSGSEEGEGRPPPWDQLALEATTTTTTSRLLSLPPRAAGQQGPSVSVPCSLYTLPHEQQTSRASPLSLLPSPPPPPSFSVSMTDVSSHTPARSALARLCTATRHRLPCSPHRLLASRSSASTPPRPSLSRLDPPPLLAARRVPRRHHRRDRQHPPRV